MLVSLPAKGIHTTATDLSSLFITSCNGLTTKQTLVTVHMIFQDLIILASDDQFPAPTTISVFGRMTGNDTKVNILQPLHRSGGCSIHTIPCFRNRPRKCKRYVNQGKSVSSQCGYALRSNLDFMRVAWDKEGVHMETRVSRYSLGEEMANSITHGIGILLAITALVILTVFAGIYGNAWHIVSVSIYGSTMILLYTASTLYHSIQQPRVKNILQVLDHSAIYLLIAGTYTPFTLVSLRGPWGWSLFGVVWGLAVFGMMLQLPFMRRWRTWSLGLYIGMGWVIVVAIKPLIGSVATGGIVFLVLGGLAYTTGILFYAWGKLKFHHAIWHLFVLAGSSLHFFAVLFYVVPILGR